MLPSRLAWILSLGAHRLDAALRRRLLRLYRPPRWLPCWFYGLWFFLVSHLARVPVIIGTAGEGQPGLETLLRRHHCPIGRRLDALHCVCTRVRPRALAALCAWRGVTRIWADGEVRALLDTAVPDGIAARRVCNRYTGRGVSIAILDTGVYPHPDLAGRIRAFRDLVGRRTSPYDDNGHGTHVASCAAGDGSRSGGRYRGPAPGAGLVVVKVLNKTGAGAMSNLLAGIDWVLANRERYRIRILNLSMGAPARTGCADDPLCQAAERAWAAGIVVVAAAGNEGPDPRTIASPGISPRVITVGALDDHGTPSRRDDTVAAFSSRGPTPDGVHKPDLLAPGVAITAARAPRSYLDKTGAGERTGAYLTLSGTSMAAPIISGICALLLEARPELTPDEVRGLLLAAADDAGLPPDTQGAGAVNGDGALAAATGASG